MLSRARGSHKFFMTEVLTPDVWHPLATTQLSSGTAAHNASRQLIFRAFPMLLERTPTTFVKPLPDKVMAALSSQAQVADFDDDTRTALLLWTVDCTLDSLFPFHQGADDALYATFLVWNENTEESAAPIAYHNISGFFSSDISREARSVFERWMQARERPQVHKGGRLKMSAPARMCAALGTLLTPRNQLRVFAAR